MTNARPMHLGLRPAGAGVAPATAASTPLSPTNESLPSQIMPHLYVGDLEQTNRETLNRLNISYILSLGLLPLVSSRSSPSTPTACAAAAAAAASLPGHNSSVDFKIKLRTNAYTTSQPPHKPTLADLTGVHQAPGGGALSRPTDGDENKGVRQTRSVHCKCINIFDNSEQTLAKFFDEAHQFIDEARRKKCNILIHCLAGISRSPAVAISYLMKANSLRLQEAYNLVKLCRPKIDPSLSFMGQLMMYEKMLEEHRGAPLPGKQQQQQQPNSKILTS